MLKLFYRTLGEFQRSPFLLFAYVKLQLNKAFSRQLPFFADWASFLRQDPITRPQLFKDWMALCNGAITVAWTPQFILITLICSIIIYPTWIALSNKLDQECTTLLLSSCNGVFKGQSIRDKYAVIHPLSWAPATGKNVPRHHGSVSSNSEFASSVSSLYQLTKNVSLDCILKYFFPLCSDIPTVGSYIQKPFRIALEKQKEKLHRKPGQGASTTTVIQKLECDRSSGKLFDKADGFVWKGK